MDLFLNGCNPIADPLQVEVVDELEPLSRDRCNTWPLRRPEGEVSTHTSPLIHEEIPEEGSNELLALVDLNPSSHSLLQHSPSSFGTGSPEAPPLSGGEDRSSPNSLSLAKKNSSRRNAWGNMSYADLITQAILSSPDKRLTLSQIYDWMVQNVPYFRDKGDSNSSAGWKTVSTSMDDEFLDEDYGQFRARSNTWPCIQPLPRISEETDSGQLPPLQDPLLDSTSSSPSQTKRRSKKSGDATQPKKPNPWGPQSYAELIYEALNAAPDGRMKLADIYEWFAQNLAYFGERKTTEASNGWKNSIRHNLSLHSRFMRIQNEGAGKSSWWVINPDAKPGKASRRRANTLETKTCEKKRGRVKRKVEAMRALGADHVTADNNSLASLPGSETSSFISDSEFFTPNGGHNEFRQRSNSNLSNYSLGSCTARLSPHMECEDWIMGPNSVCDPPSELLQLDGISLDVHKPPPPYPNGLSHSSPIKLEPLSNPSCSVQTSQSQSPRYFGNVSSVVVKCEPPAYTELFPVTSSTHHTNPMLRDALLHKQQMRQHNNQHYLGHQHAQMTSYYRGPRLSHDTPQLPNDISDICLEASAKQELQCDVDTVLRHEMSAGNGHIDFSSTFETIGNV